MDKSTVEKITFLLDQEEMDAKEISALLKRVIEITGNGILNDQLMKSLDNLDCLNKQLDNYLRKIEYIKLYQGKYMKCMGELKEMHENYLMKLSDSVFEKDIDEPQEDLETQMKNNLRELKNKIDEYL